jgi:hypothetical protein
VYQLRHALITCRFNSEVLCFELVPSHSYYIHMMLVVKSFAESRVKERVRLRAFTD